MTNEQHEPQEGSQQVLQYNWHMLRRMQQSPKYQMFDKTNQQGKEIQNQLDSCINFQAFLCKEEYGICVLPGSTLDLEQTVLYSDLIKQKDFYHVLHDGDSQLMLSEML